MAKGGTGNAPRSYDNSEYILTTGSLDTTTTAGAIACIPIPQAGQIVGIYGVETVVQSGSDTDVTFRLKGSTISFTHGAVSNIFRIQTGAAAVGKADVVPMENLNPGNATNFAYEPEDGDAEATGGVLRINTDAAGATGAMNFAIVIRP